MEKSLGLAFGVRVGLGVNKLDVNYNIVTSPLYSTLAIAALGYSGPESSEHISLKLFSHDIIFEEFVVN